MDDVSRSDQPAIFANAVLEMGMKNNRFGSCILIKNFLFCVNDNIYCQKVYGHH
jgi:hypothetical protein